MQNNVIKLKSKSQKEKNSNPEKECYDIFKWVKRK